MPDIDDTSATTRSFEEKYSVFRSDAAREVMRSVLGTDLPNGYTTLEQAERFVDYLDVGAGDLLLDLGAGRAWPGSHIAQATGCSLITSDLPMEALITARSTLAERKVEYPTEVVCADGRRLPFGDAVFDAVCHADVLC